jgi:ethanolamine-phosphate cytidylyltransferase
VTYRCLYADIVGDLFHYGHVRFLKQARALCDRLIVGVHNDSDVSAYKRTPVLTMAERIAVIEACRYTDAVVADAPLAPSAAFLDSLGAEKVVHGDDLSPEMLDYHYAELRKADRLVLVAYTPTIATTDIIRRIGSRLADGTL